MVREEKGVGKNQNVEKQIKNILTCPASLLCNRHRNLSGDPASRTCTCLSNKAEMPTTKLAAKLHDR